MPAGLDGNPKPLVSPERTALLALLSDRVATLGRGRRALVAIDGASGSGKSTLADELAGTLRTAGLVPFRASIDSFHRPRAERYRQGRDSPEGYYRDSHDLPRLNRHLLDPFAGGAPTCRLAVFDEPSDQLPPLEDAAVPAAAVLVLDGLFLHRPELADPWDLGVYLVADARREADWQGYLTRDLPDDVDAQKAEIERRVVRARRGRYVQGQALYEAEASPRLRSDIVIDNDDLSRPAIVTAPRH